MDKLTKRTEESMQDSGWSAEQIADALEDQQVRPWLYTDKGE